MMGSRLFRILVILAGIMGGSIAGLIGSLRVLLTRLLDAELRELLRRENLDRRRDVLHVLGTPLGRYDNLGQVCIVGPRERRRQVSRQDTGNRYSNQTPAHGREPRFF